ncbi:MAG: hypothetical protein WCT31_02420 [Candidatus Micrarchaeia archaeon]|jgi:hypothetical protein
MMEKTKLIGLVAAILLGCGVIGFVNEDIPSIMQDLQRVVCVPVSDGFQMCFTNQTGIIVDGSSNSMTASLQFDNKTINCGLENKVFKFQTVCANEFGYVYEKPDFVLTINSAGSIVKTITKEEVYGIFYRLAKDPETLQKNIQRGAEKALILRGIIYLAEHPEIFNKTSWNATNTTVNK